MLPVRRSREYSDEQFYFQPYRQNYNIQNFRSEFPQKRLRADDNSINLNKKIRVEDEQYIKDYEKMEKERLEKEERIKRFHAIIYG
jgi:hypothetical protein